MKILVTGTRGIPFIQGGIETHCEQLYPRIARLYKENILVMRRGAYVNERNDMTYFEGVRIKTLYAPRNKYLEAIVHSFLSVLYAVFWRPDIIHIHAIGPNLMAPLARLFGLKVVMTHHGPDYERKKWGSIAKFFLKAGEWSGVKFSNKIIVISEEIGQEINRKYGRKDFEIIPNGVPFEDPDLNLDYLDHLQLEPRKYIFSIGRFVPEKAFEFLIAAWKSLEFSKIYKLVIAGDGDQASEYSRHLKKLALQEGVILTGFIKGPPLRQLYTHARLFVLPSLYEGLPISLLEAMSYGLDIIVSNIQANKGVHLPEEDYFETGNINALESKFLQKLSAPYSRQRYDMSHYDWEIISKKTYMVYLDLFRKK